MSDESRERIGVLCSDVLQRHATCVEYDPDTKEYPCICGKYSVVEPENENWLRIMYVLHNMECAVTERESELDQQHREREAALAIEARGRVCDMCYSGYPVAEFDGRLRHYSLVEQKNGPPYKQSLGSCNALRMRDWHPDADTILRERDQRVWNDAMAAAIDVVRGYRQGAGRWSVVNRPLLDIIGILQSLTPTSGESLKAQKEDDDE